MDVIKKLRHSNVVIQQIQKFNLKKLFRPILKISFFAIFKFCVEYLIRNWLHFPKKAKSLLTELPTSNPVFKMVVLGQNWIVIWWIYQIIIANIWTYIKRTPQSTLLKKLWVKHKHTICVPQFTQATLKSSIFVFNITRLCLFKYFCVWHSTQCFKSVVGP
jgi:hypothetical protein